MQNKLLPKEKDLWSFTLPCHVGDMFIKNALADLGASVIIVPFFMFNRLGLGKPKRTNLLIEMVDKSLASLKRYI